MQKSTPNNLQSVILAVRTVPVDLPTTAFKAEDVVDARQTIAAHGKPNAPPFDEVVHAWEVVDIGELVLGVHARRCVRGTRARDQAELAFRAHDHQRAVGIGRDRGRTK